MSNVPLLPGLALVAAVIVGLHLLRPRPGRRMISSTVLWDALLRRRARAPVRWRWWLALALALAIGMLLAAAWFDPGASGGGAQTAHTLIVLDNSGSMAARTRDGRTRWVHALAQARALVSAASGPVMVADTMGRAAAPGFVSRDDALPALDRITLVSGGAASFPPLPPVSGLIVHLVSDGVALFDSPAGTVVHSVFEPADNVAITRLAVLPLATDPLHVDALVQLFNASAAEKSVQLILRGESGRQLTQRLRMAPGELIDATFDVSSFESGVLAAAALAADDALPGDDIAYAVVPQHRALHVALVARGDTALADSIASLPGVRLEAIDPTRYRADLPADVFVFEDFAPAQPPSAGALLFRPGPAPWLPAPDRTARDVVADQWTHDSALATAVPWDALSIRRATLWSHLPAGVQAAVRAGADALVVSGRASAPWTAVGFLPGDSDFPLQPSFPLFLGEALARLSAREQLSIEPLGAVRVPLADARVIDGRGNPVRSWTVPGATMFEAQRPDIYTAQTASGQVRVAAGLLDARYADINRSRYSGMPQVALAVSGPALDTWSLLALIGLVLMLIDWAALARRIAG